VIRTRISGHGFYVPENTVTNFDLEKVMDTSDTWIQERSGISERHFASEEDGGASGMAVKAAEQALAAAGMVKEDIDCIIAATLSPDYFIPGIGVIIQRKMELGHIPAYDIRQQCSGFVYGLEMADALIKSGKYRHILLVGSELQSTGLDLSTRGRDTAVLFGDGAGAFILSASESGDSDIIAGAVIRRFFSETEPEPLSFQPVNRETVISSTPFFTATVSTWICSGSRARAA